MGETVVFFSHAGGSGKTTLVRDLGYLLAQRGKQVLLIDLDPQANLTKWVGLDANPEETAATAVKTRKLPPPKRVRFGEVELDVLPSHPNLAEVEVELIRRPMGGLAIRQALAPLQNRYDFILIDSLPSLGPLAIAGALAANAAVVPVETTAKGAQTLGTTLQALRDYAADLAAINPGFAVGPQGMARLIVPNHHDPRTKSDGPALEAIREVAAGVPLSPPLVSRPGPHREASAQRAPLPHVRPKSPAARELEAVLEAFLEVFGGAKA